MILDPWICEFGRYSSAKTAIEVLALSKVPTYGSSSVPDHSIRNTLYGDQVIPTIATSKTIKRNKNEEIDVVPLSNTSRVQAGLV